MSEAAQLLSDALERLLRDLAPPEAILAWEEGKPIPGLWSAVEESGLPLLLVPEESGGVGAGLAEAVALAQTAGAAAAPLPLVESWLANRLIAAAGWAVTPGPKALALAVPAFRRLPIAWLEPGQPCLAVTEEGSLCLMDAPPLSEPSRNLAGEPMARLLWADCQGETKPLAGLSLEELLAEAALMRAAQLAGAMQRLVAMTQAHVGTREQFGRPLSAFQAVQHQLTVAAGHAAAAAMAVDSAAASGQGLALAIAKARASEAAGLVAATAHQLNGAMGFTRDYPLNLFTRRCLAWREDFGNEVFWHERIGRAAAAAGGAGLWPSITELDS